MRNPATSKSIIAGLMAVFLCAGPARGQYVSTAVTNLNAPSGVAVDTNNNLYIADTDNNRIALFVPSSGTLTTLAGSGSAGINNGTGLAASFDQPWGIVAVSNGLVVSDYGSGLIRFVTFGGTVSTLAGQPFAFLSGNAFSNGPAATATFSFPTGLAVDSAGNIYVADSQNNTIREISTGNIVSTVAVTNGYTFNLPNAVAVDDNNQVWVADSGNNCICMISNGIVKIIAGSASGQSGTNDSLTAANARFNSPSGLLWLTNDTALYISDTGNSTIRSLFLTNFNNATNYAVETIAGMSGHPGLVNGTLALAQLDAPIGLSVDPTDIGFYVADSGNHAVRVLQATAPLPPVTAPAIGYVTYPANANPAYTSVFEAITSAVFNNLTNIVISAESGTQTYISYGPTGTFIPQPGPATESPTIYPGDGSQAAQVTSAINPGPGTNDITIYAIGVESGRQSSPVVSARVQFITANPAIVGANAAAIQVTDATSGANLYYTINYGTNSVNPTNDGTSLGPVSSRTTLSLAITNSATLLVRAFAAGLANSGVASEPLSISNDIANQLTFGFANGEASSEFIGSAGERFLAPVTLTMLTGATTYAFQFDATVTNGTGPALSQFTSRFDSMLKIGPPPLLSTINPGIVVAPGMVNTGVLTNTSEELLEVAWIEVYPQTNLYPTTSQDLTEYSQAHDNVFTESGGKVIVGAFSFVIPTNASPGSTYTIQLLRPSATTFDPTATAPLAVLVQAPTNGSMTNGAINSIKTVTIGSVPYLVGDGFPFRWFNAGDFGDGVLLNDDVIEVFQSAVYAVNTPPAGSDYFDAMDSSNGTTNDIYNGNDTTINSITNGDGALKVDDVYVTLRRSLDPSLAWYDRYWSNGVRYAVAVPNVTTMSLGSTPGSPGLPGKTSLGGPRYVTVAADQVQTGGALTAQVPIRVLAADAIYPIRVAMLNLEIDPLDGSPAITNTVSFSAVTNLGSPYASASQGANNFAAAWLNSSNTGVSGTNIIGTLTVTLPPSVNTNSAYLVHFDHFSASPNGIALFNVTIQDGLITVGNRTGSSWHDGIPDTWRLLYFGTVSNILSAANADPDGDGANNWQEYIAGTNPLNIASVFKFSPSVLPSGGSFTLQWPSVVNKNYSLQRASSPAGAWTTIASNLLGNSQLLQWTDTNASANARFYRALVQ